jgi:cytochrome d ubiquinol oxidase subunit I
LKVSTPIVLARAIRFHDVVPSCFPTFSVGLASYLAVLSRWLLRTGREVFGNLFNLLAEDLPSRSGMGVVSGIVMSYQFSTNWAVFSPTRPGPVLPWCR